MKFAIRLLIALAVEKWWEGHRRRVVENREFASGLALAIISPMYMKYGTDEQVENLYDMWHARPLWEGWEDDSHRKPWWERFRKNMKAEWR